MNPDAVDTLAASVCNGCNIGDHWFLHKMKHRGEYRHLCTSCVLKLNSSTFCPVCFSVYDRPPPLHDAQVPAPLILSNTLTCNICGAVPHTSCVSPSALNSPYVCPVCSKSDSTPSHPQQQQIKDQKLSEAFVAATWIVANSLKENAKIAQVKAENKVKEALVARRKAEEALEVVALLWDREKESSRPTKEIGDASGLNIQVVKKVNYSVENDGGGHTMTNSGVQNIETKRKIPHWVEVGEFSGAVVEHDNEEGSEVESPVMPT